VRYDYTPARVRHIPLHPPRAGTPGEGIYLGLWVEFATARPREWAAIFCTNGPVRQRAASVAASFMVFMGCNGGRDFTWYAERLAESAAFPYREGAFLAAWALHNRRSLGVNNGLRTSEYMLAREYPIRDEVAFRGRTNWSLVPAVTQEDNDILESMAAWWSTHPAGVMREIAQPMIDAAERKLRSGMFKPEVETP
jgi:hypothetical protein